MPNFRVKKKEKKKKTNIKNSNTLEKKHRQKTKLFTKEKKSKKKLNNELLKINHELELLNKKGTFTPEDLEIRANLLNKKEELNDKLETINNNDNEMDYYNFAGDLITDYYNLREDKDKVIHESKCILEYLNPDKQKPKNKNKLTKSILFDKFCKRIDGIRIIKHDGTDRIKYCKECNIEKTLDVEKSSYICQICGDMELIIIDEDRQIKEYSPYKKLNHFREWLIQLQAKESTEISDNIYKDIVDELNKNRIVDLSKLNRERMQSILKKLGYNHLYEHIPYILNKLSNIPPPKIDKESEKRFLKMFISIQDVWRLYKDKNRKNFMSYSYILYKFCELLELDHLLDFFPLLKSDKKLKEQDNIWRKICKHLKWQFFPTENKNV